VPGRPSSRKQQEREAEEKWNRTVRPFELYAIAAIEARVATLDDATERDAITAILEPARDEHTARQARVDAIRAARDRLESLDPDSSPDL